MTRNPSPKWLDNTIGEISRRRIRPVDRHGSRRFLEQFKGRQVERIDKTNWTPHLPWDPWTDKART